MKLKQTAGGGRGLRLTAISAALVAAFALPHGRKRVRDRDRQRRCRDALGQHRAASTSSSGSQSQDEAMLKNPNYDDGDRNFDSGQRVLRASTSCRSSTSSTEEHGLSRQRGRLVGSGLQQARQHVDADLQPHGQRSPGARPARLHQPLREGRFRRIPRRLRVRQVDDRRRAGQRQARPDHGVLGREPVLNGALHSVAYSQNPIDVWKGLATPGAEAKELFRPRVGLNLQAQVTDDWSVAAQYFFNWQSFSNQAFRYPESGSYLSIGDALLWGGESLIANADRHAAACWRGTDITPDENTGQLGPRGALEPGVARRHARRATTAVPTTCSRRSMPTPAVRDHAGAALHGPRRHAARPGHSAMSIRRRHRCRSCAQVGRSARTTWPSAPNIDIFGVSLVEEHRRHQRRRRTELPPQHAAGERSGEWCCRPPSRRWCRARSRPMRCRTATRRAPRATTMHGLVNAARHHTQELPVDSATWATELTWMTWLDVNQNEAVFKGRDGYSQIDRVSKNYFGLAINYTPTWYQVLPGVDILAPLSWSAGDLGQFGHHRRAVRRAPAPSASASRRTSTRSTASTSSTWASTATTRPARAVPVNPGTCAAGAANVFNGNNAVLSDRDFVALTFKTTF